MKQNTNQDLILPSGWIVWDINKEQQFEKLVFNVSTRQMQVFDKTGAVVQAIDLDKIDATKISKIIRAPMFYLTINDVIYTVGLFANADSLRKMASRSRPVLIVLFGELAYPSADAAATGSKQIFNDYMEKMHNWLQGNQIKSYTSKNSRNTLFAYFFIGLAIAALPVGVLIATIISALF